MRNTFKANTDVGKSEVVAHTYIPANYFLNDIVFQGKSVKYVDSSPVLGVQLDGKLNWIKHTNMIVSRCWHKWSCIKKYISRHRGLKAHTIKLLVNISVIPVILYCSPCWLYGSISKFAHLFYDINVTCTGVHFKPQREIVECLTGIVPLQIQYKTII